MTDDTSERREDGVDVRQSSLCQRLISHVSVEPVIFLVALSFGIQIIISQDLLIFKICSVNFNFSTEICSNLSAHAYEQILVQKKFATLSMWQSVLTAVPSVIVSLFLGPWSDYHGRKPLLITPTIGFLVIQIVNVTCIYFKSLPAEYLLFTSVANIFGGFTCLLIGVYGYIADVTKLRSRTSRVAVVDLFFMLAYPLGVFLSDHIFKLGGFYLIFGIGFALNVVAILYAVFVIREPCERDESINRVPLVAIGNVLSVFSTVFKRRENGLRPVLLLLLTAMFLNVSNAYDGGMTYLFTRLKFSWTEEEYTLWSSSTITVRAFATIAAMPILSMKLHLHDALIGFIGSTLGLAGFLVYAFASKWWMMYLGAFVAIISTGTSVVIRSLISKVVPKVELGKVFSLLSSLESIVPLIISPIITMVYKHTINSFAGAIFIVFATISLLVAAVLMTIYVLLKRSDGYDHLHEEQVQNSSEDTDGEDASFVN